MRDQGVFRRASESEGEVGMGKEDPSRVSSLVPLLHYSMFPRKRGEPKKVRPEGILGRRQEGEGVSKARCAPFWSKAFRDG